MSASQKSPAGRAKSKQAHKPAGIPEGGQFTAVAHSEEVPSLGAGPIIRMPSQPALHDLIYNDRPSNEERRHYGRKVIEQVLEGDDFNVVFSEEDKAAIREEAERDDSLDRALEKEWSTPHHLGDALARDLAETRKKRLAVEKHYVPTDEDTFHAAATHIKDSPEEYRKAVEEALPYLGSQWMEALMRNHELQPEDWQRRELSKAATINEAAAAFAAERPIVSEEENPNFTSHPVSALESRIDGLIAHRGDPTCDENLRYLASMEGAGYGTENIKILARKRLAAWRHAPIETNN
jgi:hypothetical protein